MIPFPRLVFSVHTGHAFWFHQRDTPFSVREQTSFPSHKPSLSFPHRRNAFCFHRGDTSCSDKNKPPGTRSRGATFGLRALARLSCPPRVIRALSSTISHLPVSDRCEVNLTRPGDQLCVENYASERSAYVPFLGNTPRKHTRRRSPGRERTTWDPGRTGGARREDTSTSHLNG